MTKSQCEHKSKTYDMGKETWTCNDCGIVENGTPRQAKCEHRVRGFDKVRNGWVCEKCQVLIPRKKDQKKKKCSHSLTQYNTYSSTVTCVNCHKLLASKHCHKYCPKCFGKSIWTDVNRAKCESCETTFPVVLDVLCPTCKSSQFIKDGSSTFLKDKVTTNYHCFNCAVTFSDTKARERPGFGVAPVKPQSYTINIKCPKCSGRTNIYNATGRGYCTLCSSTIIRRDDGSYVFYKDTGSNTRRSSSTATNYETKWKLNGPCRDCGTHITVYSGRGGWCSTCKAQKFPKVTSKPYTLELDL